MSLEESGGYRCLNVCTSSFEAKIRATQVRKWSRNELNSWSGKIQGILIMSQENSLEYLEEKSVKIEGWTKHLKSQGIRP